MPPRTGRRRDREHQVPTGPPAPPGVPFMATPVRRTSMKSRIRWAGALCAAAAIGTPALSAQDHDHSQLGRVVFPVSCNAEAQRRFETAMTILHSFWWEKGDEAFGHVLAADSGCAMAWWGLAM